MFDNNFPLALHIGDNLTSYRIPIACTIIFLHPELNHIYLSP